MKGTFQLSKATMLVPTKILSLLNIVKATVLQEAGMGTAGTADAVRQQSQPRRVSFHVTFSL